MTQDPLPQPGWYPQGPGQERWWNGASWSDTFRPAPPAPPPAPPADTGSTGQPVYAPVPYGPPGYAQPGYGQPGYGQPGYGQSYYAPPQGGGGHVVRNVLLGVALVLVLCVAGCIAVVAVAVNKVDDTVNDQTPGGPNVPLTITEGQPFSVKDFDYAAGWSVATDATGDVTVQGLMLTNHRDKADYAVVHVDLRQGGTVRATVSCSLPGGSIKIAKGETQTLSCYSFDPLPTYDTLTIMDDL